MTIMKKKFKFFSVLLVSVMLLTGCSSSDLKKVYKTMTIGDGNGKVNSYQVSIRLYGLYNDEKLTQIVTVQNFKNKSYKVIDSTNNLTYYKVDGKNYSYVQAEKEEIEDEEQSSDEKVEDDLFDSIIPSDRFGNFGNDNNVVSGSYKETSEEIPFTDTDIYLSSLDKAKSISEPETEVISEISYTKYSYLVSKRVMSRIVANTILKDVEFESDTNATVWIDSNGYVYKIEYDLASGLGLTYDLVLNAYYSSINDVDEITESDIR